MAMALAAWHTELLTTEGNNKNNNHLPSQKTASWLSCQVIEVFVLGGSSEFYISQLIQNTVVEYV